jgi:hypothetical protein
MSSGAYYNQPSYPGVSFPPLVPPPQASVAPRRAWPLRAVNRWMTAGVIAITLLAVLLAFLAPQATSAPPSTTGWTPAYQSSLTQNNTGRLHWDQNDHCQFTDAGYVISSSDPALATHCFLQGSNYQDFILHVRVVSADQVAIIGFLVDDRLAIFGDGRYQFYQNDPVIGTPRYLIPPTAGIGAGSVALHPTSLGVSERVNDITIQVQESTYSFYANGQLLATYTAPALENPGPISLGAGGGQQALFSDIAIYTISTLG